MFGPVPVNQEKILIQTHRRHRSQSLALNRLGSVDDVADEAGNAAVHEALLSQKHPKLEYDLASSDDYT
jgi:hypothetical protein